MASVVDIVNLALSHLGDSATVSSIEPPETSIQAEKAAIFYPVARDELLELHAWGFATTRVTLPLLAFEVDGWAYVYGVPADMIRPLEVYETGIGPDPRNPVAFETETLADGTPVILTDTIAAELRYIRRVADPNTFSPLFTTTLSWLLAAYLAGPLMKGETGAAAARSCYTVYRDRLASATATNANAGRQRLDTVAPWIAGR